jgi:hypothetical protein
MAVRRGMKVQLKKRKKGWLKGLSTPNLTEGVLLILVPPSASCIGFCSKL